MTGRRVPEWIGKTPDTKVPDKVRERVYQRHKKRCYLSGIPIAGKPWELEHIVPLSMGGENRESNLAPALVNAHKLKTAKEASERAKADAAARRHSGSKAEPVRKIKSAGFRPSPRHRQRHPMPALPPRPLFVERR